MANENFQQWDPTKNITNIGGITPRAYGDGDMFTAAFDNNKRSKRIGIDGLGRHIKNADKSGIFTLRLATYSPTVAAIQILDELDIPFAIATIDKTSNGDGFFAASCMLMKEPDLVKGATETVLEYQFEFIKGKIIRAGAEAATLLNQLAALAGITS